MKNWPKADIFGVNDRAYRALALASFDRAAFKIPQKLSSILSAQR